MASTLSQHEVRTGAYVAKDAVPLMHRGVHADVRTHRAQRSVSVVSVELVQLSSVVGAAGTSGEGEVLEAAEPSGLNSASSRCAVMPRRRGLIITP